MAYNPISSTTNLNAPYGNQYYSESTGYITPMPAPKKRTSNWIKFGIPIAVVVIAGAVVGVILGIRASKHSGSAASDGSASSAASIKNSVGLYATATNSEFMVPLYPSTTNTAAFTTPTFNPSTDSRLAWPKDPFQPASPTVTSLRTDRPLLIAPAYKWDALPTLIQNDPYLQAWNDTIFFNATDYFNKDPVVYFMDGPSGILDNAREVKERVKAFAYVYRLTNDTKWVDRTWLELQNAAGNTTNPFGNATDRWNSAHFLDTAEFSAAYGIAYDWLYDMWSDDQKSQIMFTLLEYGLKPGVQAYTDPTVYTGWWKTNTTGNWNCVCNAGLTIASLAILNDDTTGTASQLLGLTIDNAKQNCAFAVTDDGSWTETANYWYFGTTAHAEMAASLITATGSDYGLLDVNPSFALTGNFHMYVYGPTSLFDYGDHGPNKFSTTANAMFLYATHYNKPEYALFQRDRPDAAEPWSMFWYDPTVSGAYWNGKALDYFFDNELSQWASMRSSWTDETGLFVAMKAGKLQGRQTHNDLDIGDFVLDAQGTRWAGEFGSGDYRSPDYFTSDAQNATRWTYYRKMTEGQNTILIGQQNQIVTANPTIVGSGSSGTTQGSSTVLDLASDSTAFWVVDMTSAYGQATSVKRGVRLLNGRRQVLIQDEITASASIEWRMQTNATIDVDSSGTTATLNRDGKTMKVYILSPTTGATFTTSDAVRFPTDPTPPVPDQDNTPVKVLIISLEAGTYNLQVLFNPQWEGFSDFVTPKSVDLSNWSVTSHN